MYVRAGRPAFARPCVGIHKSTSLMIDTYIYIYICIYIICYHILLITFLNKLLLHTVTCFKKQIRNTTRKDGKKYTKRLIWKFRQCTPEKCIPTKLKTKYRVPWETLAVRGKRALVKTASKNYRKNPTNTNALKLKTAQYQLAGIYIKEQTEYIQNQIDKIRDSVEDRQSRIAWQTINEVSRRKNTAKAKLKAANQLERIKLWKQHFENLLGNPPKITHEPITRIISKQLDNKLGAFTQEELDSVLRKIKNRKAAGLDEIPPEVWKTRQFDDILLRHCNAVYNQNPIDR